MKTATEKPKGISVDDLDEAIERYRTESGFRLDMIVPADAPVAAVLSRDGEEIRLEATAAPTSEPSPSKTWIRGRAGMMYRDLIPGRLGGELIASHIRLTVGGEVPDYVHYHKVLFQMIYCVRGAIKVVYEDQGDPLWLKRGDCVLQPPEIRHRVLSAEEGSEVVELGIPAVHETWVEHEMTLPTADLNPDRDFNGQRFVRHIAADHVGEIIRDTGIAAATGGFADVRVVRSEVGERLLPVKSLTPRDIIFGFVISGEIRSTAPDTKHSNIHEGEAFIVVVDPEVSYECISKSEVLIVGF